MCPAVGWGGWDVIQGGSAARESGDKSPHSKGDKRMVARGLYSTLILLLVSVAAVRAAEERATLAGVPILDQAPSCPAELVRALQAYPDMAALARDAEAIDTGLQTLVYGEHLPLGPAPATPWAKPLPGGPLKLVFIGQTNNCYDLAEVQRRVDCQVRFIHLPDQYYFAKTYPEAVAGYYSTQALATLEHEADVILADPLVRILSPQVAAAIQRKVQAGCGLGPAAGRAVGRRRTIRLLADHGEDGRVEGIVRGPGQVGCSGALGLSACRHIHGRLVGWGSLVAVAGAPSGRTRSRRDRHRPGQGRRAVAGRGRTGRQGPRGPVAVGHVHGLLPAGRGQPAGQDPRLSGILRQRHHPRPALGRQPSQSGRPVAGRRQATGGGGGKGRRSSLREPSPTDAKLELRLRDLLCRDLWQTIPASRRRPGPCRSSCRRWLAAITCWMRSLATAEATVWAGEPGSCRPSRRAR